MSKDELITLAKGHIKGARAMKKDVLLKALKAFIASNPGKILVGTEEALRDGINSDEEDGTSKEVGQDAEGNVDMEFDNDASKSCSVSQSVDNANASKSCSIMECDGTDIEELTWCGECDLWFCKYLHGPHSNHSAQTHLKEGRIRKNAAAVVEEAIENISPSADASIDPVAVDSACQTAEVVRETKKRQRSQYEGAVAHEPVTSCDMVRVAAATRKLREILERPSKTRNEQLRSALNFSSYDITFLTMVAQEFGIDITSVANKSRASRIHVLDYLLSML